jgi:hypothetical protein
MQAKGQSSEVVRSKAGVRGSRTGACQAEIGCQLQAELLLGVCQLSAWRSDGSMRGGNDEPAAMMK